MPRLVINPGTPSAWEIQLRPGTNRLGRGFDNDFKIDHGSVSTSHCQIIVENGDARLKDLGSTNGTFVNRAPVSEAPLQSGQTIHLGGVELLFQGDTAPIGPLGQTEIIPRPPSLTATPLPPIGQIETPPAPAAAPVPTAPRLSISAPRLSISTHAAPAAVHAPAEEPDMPPPPRAMTPGPGVFSGQGKCKFHPKTPGRYRCGKCNLFFCELCVTSRAVGEEQHKFCRKCGNELMAVRVTLQREQVKGFYASLPGAFTYPFKGAGVLVLIIGTILFAALNWLSPPMQFGYIPRGFGWGLIGQVFAIGYLFTFMQSIIHAAAIGDEEMPTLPSMGNFWEDILLPCLQLLGLVLICFGPAIAVAYFTVSEEESSLGPALIACVIFGALYAPMAFLSVAMLDSVMAANPIQVLPSIFKVPVEYLITVTLLGIVLALRPLGDVIIPIVFPRGLTTHSMAKLFGYLGAEAFWSLFSLYLLVVGIRILGLLYYTRKDKLNWLTR
ncbi:MAG TPA: FHA domain-containing protein [Candidatus Dormibacteraeota bacterium]|nr:FHA domain-containing protein [Candidatus Dormibacteraeota bacterium]